jgi:HEAT repeat protein
LIPVLSAAADDEKIEARVETARILSRIMALAASKIHSSGGDPTGAAVRARSDSEAILYRLFKDRVPEVRAAAADSLGDGGLNPLTAAELTAAAGDPDRGVRLEIARALLRVNGPDDRTAAGMLTSLVADREPVSDRSLAMDVLLQAGEQTRNRALLALAEQLSHADPLVQPDLLACLEEAGSQARVALPALEKLLDDPEPGTRAAAVRAILQIEDKTSPRLTAVMLEMIADKSLAEERRMEILSKIKELAPTVLARAAPDLIRQLGDGNSDVRRAALDLLSIIIEDTPAEMPKQPAIR